ncbi:AfsR/SARP family transcriptional regulator [Streptomyces sp. WAC07149]|uniref:ATP-binding protein n=1 Tax=Streptomyces sp. WAC07149 TaxID=2487425 RepID=UPI000F7A08DC|nr:BTAD domain-containing putative transcriptional regulator [Streptomyces sp. WAC07149]RST06987.1 AfsR/SARP family transcriptional regulator [Streptomyces sp. WAC07149]
MTMELTTLTTVAFRGREITAPRMRGLIALLAGELRAGCGTARLIEELWPDERPAHPVKALQVLVSRARTRLGPGVIASTPGGYRLALGAERVDASAVLLHTAACAAKSRSGDHAGALAEAEAGLALWGAGDPGHGEPVPGDPLSALRAERRPAHRSLLRARALGLARTSRESEALAPLAELVRELPRDEELLLELVRCEAATAGAATALATYDRHRRALRDDLGTDPGPALRALHGELLRAGTPAVRRGVPHEPNELLGRADDIAAVARLLRTSRVTSIVGPGGLGKTRLAAAVAREAAHRTVHLVALAGVTRDADVAGEVASALGAADPPPPGRRPAAPADLSACIAGALGPGPALLVLDNCEHVLEGAADLVRALVALTRDLRILTTGRAPLGLSSEAVHPLPELDRATTVRLFEQRARAARPGAELPARQVAELCRRLDGLPLAVELAAARVRVMSVADMTRRLDDRFALLRGGPRDAPLRHRTLHAVVDWSWNLLEPAGRTALRALSVFPGGFTAEAAAHLLGDGPSPAPDVLDTLADLADQSLLKVADTGSGTRFRMLETVREFAAAHRDRAGETEHVTGQLLLWARDFGLARHDAPFGPDPYTAWHGIRAEHDNLVLALRLALARRDAPTVAAVGAVLCGLWATEGNHARLIPLAAEAGAALTHYRPEPEHVEATRTAAVLLAVSPLLGGAPAPPRLLALLRRLPPAPADTLPRALGALLRGAPGVFGRDRTPLDALRGSGEPLLAGVAEGLAAYLWENEDEPERAMKAARRMLTAVEGHRIPWLQVIARSRLGELCLRAERGEEAVRHLREAVRVLDPLGDRPDTMGLRWGMVLGHLQTGEVDEAERRLEQAARNGPQETEGVPTPELGARAEIELARGGTERGLRLWRRAAALPERSGGPVLGLEVDLEPWVLELRAAAVAAHAHHGRLGPVEELAARLPERARARLERGAPADLPVCGAVLLALGTADLVRGAAEGRAATVDAGVRLLALTESFRCLRTFQPTMSSARARQAARLADRTAYEDAVSGYAALDRDGLRRAALDLLRQREGG